ncbi:hypothetical protein [Sphingobacterium sp. DR205]|uniref:hypothetical protein n=1 Tax=Sphingobacterium sp. DR205 TaxID=2713573 RepID=UPI0013E45459|nr:hypothetical protein [Sphingobacterium sp. DR205]QIH33142.1 hypothetical protein G6053_09710 [Sphingobacterium sp. DR205]
MIKLERYFDSNGSQACVADRSDIGDTKSRHVPAAQPPEARIWLTCCRFITIYGFNQFNALGKDKI